LNRFFVHIDLLYGHFYFILTVLSGFMSVNDLKKKRKAVVLGNVTVYQLPILID